MHLRGDFVDFAVNLSKILEKEVAEGSETYGHN